MSERSFEDYGEDDKLAKHLVSLGQKDKRVAGTIAENACDRGVV
jgi:hypothetical protein